MSTVNTVKSELTAIISKANAKTGGSDKTVSAAVDRLVGGYNPNGITPSGKKPITTNGTHDVTSYASAEVNVPIPSGYIKPSGSQTITTNGEHDVTTLAKVNVQVPASGITPSGSQTFTENGEYDVTTLAKVVVNVAGANIRVFTSTVSADATSGTPTIAAANEFIASIRSNSNAFVLVRYAGVKSATTMLTYWFAANFPIAYGGGSGTTAYNTILGQQSATYQNATFNTRGLTSENYSGHLCVATNGRLYCYPSANYPLRAGTYQIIAGTL